MYECVVVVIVCYVNYMVLITFHILFLCSDVLDDPDFGFFVTICRMIVIRSILASRQLYP